ncbi:MAG TPA: FHA domain-containing protein [Anaerolineae bacterium]|nr:FHA domain-containing protein [Anaerolineae bacterium]
MPSPSLFAKLIAIHADVSPAQFVIEADLCTLGRSPTCQVVIARQTVSRLHARIERDEAGRYFLYDAQSANGIFMNSQRQRLREPLLLRDGDEIGLGGAEPLLRFEDPNSTSTVRASRMIIDAERLKVYLDKVEVELTPGQFRLLQHLFAHADEICTRESCAEALWSRAYDPVLDDQPLNRMVSNIRTQLKIVTPDQEWIVTHRGLGYTLLSDP